MFGLNYMAWIGIVSWIGVPLLAFFTSRLLWRRSQSDLSRLLALVTGVVILFAPALISNGVKAYYDRQVRELCVKDGGVRVYERVALPRENFDEFGDFRIPIKANAQETDPYYYEWRDQNYRDGNPTIRRDHAMIFRKSDGKLLGEAISYGRGGGDLPGPWERGTSFRCPGNTDITDLNKQIFIKN